ncbi:MAG: hypothetical protein L0Z50_01210 [Verrucomicrobiales bacterium]|nr:hypothetical protein [Verrucomicrobiales bacterium]
MKSSAKKQTLERSPGSGLGSGLILVRVFSAVGLTLSAYLLWGSLTQGQLPGCGFESGCNAVLHSRWATWFGLPVSGLALFTYGLILGGTSLLQRSSEPLTQKRVWCVLIAAGATLAAAAVWFISLQLFAVRAICPFCMAAHACGLLVAIVLFAIAPTARSNAPSTSSNRRTIQFASRPFSFSVATAAKSALGGLAAVLVLGAGQIIQPIKTYDVQPIAGNALSTTNLAANLEGMATFNARTNSEASATRETVVARSRRILQLHGDVFSLDLHEVPLHGSPEAKHVLVHLFDYSCKHCRELHPILGEAVHGLSNQVAIVSLPMPLDGKCNPMIKRVLPDHTNACAYARAGLAVWRSNPGKLEEFDDWIFSPERPPEPEAVRAEAMRLVGTNAFAAALRDPWIDQQLNLSIRLYQTNYLRYRQSQLPEMMIGTNLISGVPPNVGVLYRFLAAKLAVQVPDVTP